MADLLAQLLSLAMAGTMMISTGLNAGAPHNDINGLLYLQNRQWRASSAYVPPVREANVAAAISVTRMGAQPAAPTREEIREMKKR